MLAVLLIALIENGWCSPRSIPIGCSSCSARSFSRRSASTAGAPSRAGRPDDAARDRTASARSFPERAGARRRLARVRARRDPRADGRERRRQVDADQDHHRRATGPMPARSCSTASPVAFASPRDALAAGIGAVHQERNLDPALLGRREHPARAPADQERPRRLRRHRPARRAELLDLLDPGDRHAGRGARRCRSRRCSSSRSPRRCRSNASVLLLDEPTASITDHEAAALFAVLRRLTADGVAIVFVSHKLDEVMAISDRVTRAARRQDRRRRRADRRRCRGSGWSR